MAAPDPAARVKPHRQRRIARVLRASERAGIDA